MNDRAPTHRPSPVEPVAGETGPSSVPASARGLAWALIACAAFVFWPLTRWVAAETVQRSQIRQGFLFLVAAAVVVAYQHRRELRLAYDLGNRSVFFLGAAFLLAVGAMATGWSVLMLPACASGLAGCLHVLFGAGSYRFLKPLVMGFAAFLLIILLFPALDWPLRELAGRGTAAVLHAFGLTPHLGVLPGGGAEGQRLMLKVGGRMFHVATECNGFGLITSGALLALLVGGIVGRRPSVIVALMLAAVATGFAVNVLRILSICLLAPYFPNHYLAMHEVLGTIALWAGLGLIGWLAWRPAR